MKRLILLLSAFSVLLLAACSAETEPAASSGSEDGLQIVVYRSPT